MKVLLVGGTHNGQLDHASIQSFYQLEKGNAVVDLFMTLASSELSFSLPQDILDRLHKVLVGKNISVEAGLPEDLAPVIARLAGEYDLVVAGKGRLMDQVMTRSAALLGVDPLLGTVKIIDKNTLQYQAYNNSVEKTVSSEVVPKIMTMVTGLSVSVSTEALVEVTQGMCPKIKNIAMTDKAEFPLLKVIHTGDAGNDDLETAQIIIGCGAGIDNLESFELVRELAEELGAALGASKLTVEAGYLPSSALIGQSGKTVSPKVYLALGISGSAHHLGAVQGADTIIAVNSDGEAPILKISDYSLIGDIRDIIPKLTDLLKD